MNDAVKRNVAWHAALAILLMLLFFALGAAAIVGLTWSGMHILALVTHISGRGVIMIVIAGIACFIAAVVILWSLLPRWDRFVPPGPELDPAKEPELFAEIAAIAKATGQAPPKHVYAVLDMNAFVTERGGVMGLGSRRVMGLGIPLMQLLTVAELRAVIAHEFGHFYGGDTKVGPWVYKTRGAVWRAVGNLTSAARTANSAELGLVTLMMLGIRKPFMWFGQGFMRVTQAVSRSQEIAADALACQTVGSEPLASGLQKSAGGGLGFQLYLREDVGPMVSHGYRPPIVDGFARFLGAAAAKGVMARATETHLDEAKADPYDSHPPLKQRVDAANALAIPTRDPDARPAISLLHDVSVLEDATLQAKVRDLPRMGWDGAIELIKKGWHKSAEEWRSTLTGMTCDALTTDATTLRHMLRKVHPRAEAQLGNDEIRGWARSIYFTALSLQLLANGFEASTSPGEPIIMRRDDVTLDLGDELRKRFEGTTDATAWSAWIGSLGLAGKALV